MPLTLRALSLLLGLAVLGFIFMEYGKTDFLLVMVNQLWSCF
jgi:hypothetical protein